MAMTTFPRFALLVTGAMLSAAAQGGATIDLAAEASRPAVNDMVLATVYAEANGANPADLAKRVNLEIAEALKVIKSKPAISVKSGQQSSFPIYNQAQKIEGWRMHAELILESSDLAAVSEIIGRLQQMKLVISQVGQQPSPATKRQVEDEATRDAIRAFQSRAEVVAGVFGKPYRIKQLSVQQNGGIAPMHMLRGGRMAMAADAAPIEAGESLISTTVSGQIELLD
jgi:predicted secreted protein